MSVFGWWLIAGPQRENDATVANEQEQEGPHKTLEAGTKGSRCTSADPGAMNPRCARQGGKWLLPVSSDKRRLRPGVVHFRTVVGRDLD